MKGILEIFKDTRRWRNPATYLSLLAAVPSILALFKIHLELGQWEAVSAVVKSIISLLVVFGILMNPTSPGFGDRKVEQDQPQPEQPEQQAQEVVQQPQEAAQQQEVSQ